MFLFRLLLLLSTFILVTGQACCNYPCHNGGACVELSEEKFYCDCSNTNYWGVKCESTSLLRTLKNFVMPQSRLVYIARHFKYAWAIVNFITPLHNFIMSLFFNDFFTRVAAIPPDDNNHDYTTLEGFYNMTQMSRHLPPVPKNCPKPMGSKGPEKLPDPTLVYDAVFKRQDNKFIPNKLRSNVLFAFFAQLFTHNFFQTPRRNQSTDLLDPFKTTNFQHEVTFSALYGVTQQRETILRELVGGLLKTSIRNGEEYPPLLSEIRKLDPEFEMYFYEEKRNIPADEQFAFGNPFFSQNPGLFVWHTIFLREHNRVARILKEKFRHWDDERIFQTSKLILISILHTVVLQDYVQHLGGLHLKVKYDPPLMFGIPPYGTNRYRVEFNHLYHWHGLVPDWWIINQTRVENEQFYFRANLVFEHGVGQLIKSFSEQWAGDVARHNFGPQVKGVVEQVIQHQRELRLRPLNEYRKLFELKPHESFEELAGSDKELAQKLEEMYHHVDAVEMFPGLFAEEPVPFGLQPETATAMGVPYALFGIYTHPLSSPFWWKPSTFGDESMIKYIQDTNVENLVCRNIKGECPRVKFTVPDDLAYEAEAKQYGKDEL